MNWITLTASPRRLPGRRYLLLYAACGWLAGLWVGGVLVPPLSLAVATAFACSAALARWRRTVPVRLALVAVIAGCLGVARAQQAQVMPISPPAGVALQLRGVVDSEPDVRDRSVRFVVYLEQQRLSGGWTPARGKVLVETGATLSADYGDRLLLRGVVETPQQAAPDGFDYRLWLQRQGIGGIMRFPALTIVQTGQAGPLAAAAVHLRERVEETAGQILPEPQASLLRASLVGTRSATFADLTPDFVATGMVHLIATSGFKVAIVAGALLSFLTPLVGRRRAMIPCLVGVAGYVALTGATPAGVRAGLMWAAACSAVLAGRWGSSGQALALAAAVLGGVDPPVLFDSGFQLSAVATAGLLVVGPSLEPWLRGWPRGVAEPVSATIAAQVATLPILMVGFHQVSLVAPVANLLCLPALPWIMALGALAEVVGWVNLALGSAVAWLVWAPLTWMIWVVHALAALPFAYRPASGQGSLFTAAYYALLIGALALAPRPRDDPARSPATAGATAAVPSAGWRRLLAPGVMALAAAAAIVAALPRDPLMHVVVLDVGKGDATLVTDPSGRRILIDAGSSPRTLALRLGELLPPWTRRLDLLVLSSYDQDELQGAIEVAARYRPRAALEPAGRGSGALYEQWAAGAAQAGVDVQPVTGPVSLVLAGNSRLEARPVRRTGSAAAKDPRLAVRLVNGDFAAVFGGNLDASDQQQLVDDGAPLGATLLVIPHNGTPGSVAAPFLRAVAPSGAAIAVDPAGKADSPSGDTLDQLAGMQIYRTDELGTLDIITDGHGWGLRR